MASVLKNSSIRDYQDFTAKVYGVSNDKHFSTQDMLTNIQRFLMRGMKGIRKQDNDKIKLNLLISLSWYMSLLSRLHINIEEEIWHRFPFVCSYCGFCPCVCKAKKISKRQKIRIDSNKRPKTIQGFEKMFRKIYPPEKRTLTDSGIHLSEEMGELSEAILIYKARRDDADFRNVKLEAADFFSCLMGVFNSLGINLSDELIKRFKKNCHECHKAPCKCSFEHVLHYKS